LIVGYAVSVSLGLLIGWHAQDFFSDLTLLFRHHAAAAQAPSVSPTVIIIMNLIFYPPIAVLVIDSVHAVASRIDTG
jgi:hypothetical protein